LLAFVSRSDQVQTEKIERAARRAFAKNGVRVRPINMKDFDGEVARVWEVYCAAWSRNWGFVPMTARSST